LSAGDRMSEHTKNNYFVLTGAMGAGKSTILKELTTRKFLCVEEPARPIIAEQRNIDGEGVYEKNPRLFTELMLSRSMFQFQQMQNYKGPIIFDRGIPDNIVYAQALGFDLSHIHNAAKKYRYNNIVFFTPGWREIYRTDEERKMSFEAANQFGNDLKKIYLNLGYQVIDVPLESPEARAKFIIKAIY
jgi:predicted ATPase